jgi:hypothetical protein
MHRLLLLLPVPVALSRSLVASIRCVDRPLYHSIHSCGAAGNTGFVPVSILLFIVGDRWSRRLCRSLLDALDQ